jgi:hypothetical protein
MSVSVSEAEAAVTKTQIMDGLSNVFVIIAHDTSLLDILPFFPLSLSDWSSAGYKRVGTWRFLRDFRNALKSGV